ncbi:MAG: aminotransferase class V-fold PLP-dependent enzyme [Blautia sp.]|uniref:aminotransferase class V-fold PLP-dependent enzyme n=1 Tax=Blautia sp. TaxID=1955243 RepID=UPI002A7599C2|nr:aminotransferase class V-fold PLP-dependent enzyme [Blautia sp.]MDY3018108.1 aminotransferase class V-fold PLP-dependent enzyme [Blautia sp.]
MIYFDNAATTMHKPEPVIHAVVQAMNFLGNAGRGAHEASLDASRNIYGVRERISEFFHGEDPSRIAFTSNSTESLNTAIKGILDPGDHVVTTVLEHNSVLRPLYEMQEKGVEVTILPCDGYGMVYPEDFAAAVRPNTKAFICTHGSNLTGNVPDIRQIGKIARDRGIRFVVDASQTAGVFDIDVQKMNIDILCFTGHKGLLGPQGTGGMYVRTGVNVRPLKSGGSGVKTFEKKHPAQMPTALEAGTLNGHGLAGLGAAVDYLNQKGITSIRKKEQELMEKFYLGVRDIPGVKVYGDFRTMERCAIVTLNIRDYDSGEVGDALYMDYGIAARTGAHCAPLMHQSLGTAEQGAVRFSFSHFNTEEEIQRGIDAVRELAE